MLDRRVVRLAIGLLAGAFLGIGFVGSLGVEPLLGAPLGAIALGVAGWLSGR